jgi:mono/diheme cytochrome c family protein
MKLASICAVACCMALAAVASARAAPDPQDFSQAQRGRYLTIVSDCAACHSQPGSRNAMAGGRPIETPFGTLLAPNITPDRATGIGTWTDDEFVDALTRGIGRDGQHLYPAMPFTYFTKMSREDALAIRAYLTTLPPVVHAVRPNQLPFPFNIRASMAAWDALYFKPGQYRPDPGKPAVWNRGAYLVEGPTHCGMCHTPKTALGGDEANRALQGATLQGWFAPDITNAERTGLGTWSKADIVQYLKTGHNRISAASGPMGEEVSLSSSQMRDDDLDAIATYLKDQPAAPSEAAVEAHAVPASGAAIYADKCAACHALDGAGVPGLFPTLRGSSSVMSREPTSLIHVVLRGAKSVATDQAPTGPAMPSFGWLLSDDQVAAVTTYIRNAWGNGAAPVTSDEVARMRRSATVQGSTGG